MNYNALYYKFSCLLINTIYCALRCEALQVEIYSVLKGKSSLIILMQFFFLFFSFGQSFGHPQICYFALLNKICYT